MTKRSASYGPICPNCSQRSSSVSDSRPLNEGSIRRRRRCNNCGTAWNTVEIPDGQFKALLGAMKNWVKETKPRGKGGIRSKYEVPPELVGEVARLKNKGIRMYEIAAMLQLKERKND